MTKLHYIYRYRPLRIKDDGTSYLIDELKNNYFFLTPSTKENDTNEGRPNFFLKGSKTLWLGIFRYLYYYVGAYELIKRNNLHNITNSMINASTKLINAKNFLKNHKINLILNSIKNKQVSLLELKILFLSVLNIVIRYINKSINIHKTYVIPTLQYMDKKPLIKLAIKLITNPQHKENAQIMLDEAYLNSSKNIKQILMGYICLINDFSNSLTHLSLPTAGIISFARDDENDAMWGQYANAYNGVCLKYKVSYNNQLKLNKIKTKKDANTLYKVHYQSKLNSYNLFHYLDPSTKPLFKEVKGCFYKELKKRYKNMQIHSFSTKDSSWQHENEYRAIIFNLNKGQNKQYYDFHILKAVILGSQISEKYKNEIVQVLQKQCNSYPDIKHFHIYEMQRIDNFTYKNGPKDKPSRKPLKLLRYSNILRKFVPWIKNNDIIIYPNIL